MRVGSPYLISAGIHGLLLLVLAWWIIPVMTWGEVVLQTVFSQGEEQKAPFEIDDGLDSDDLQTDLPTPVAESLPSESSASSLADELFSLTMDPQAFLSEPAVEERRQGRLVGEDGSLKRAASLEGAVDGITSGIIGDLRKGDLLVVWLFDSSQSLVDDRQRIAARLETFFTQIAEHGASKGAGRLINAVAGFGARLKERVQPTESRDRVVKAIQELPIDPSGEENVFGAITRCVERYSSSNGSKRMTVVVWMDESGDDTEQLEEVITLCRDNHATIHIVGPSAVLGDDTGLHTYTDPKTQLEFLLPVTRGPDTAVRERLRLGYWFRARPSRLVRGDGASFYGPSWYGGRDLKGMNSGFSPYGLTRLAIETGGTYTLFDPSHDRPPFELEAMKNYLPDYGRADDYLETIQQRPLRRAVYAAVQVTRSNVELLPPSLLLFGKYAEIPPYRFETPYLTPAQFRRKLRAAKPGLVRKAARNASVVDEALAFVSRDDETERGLEQAYADEPSARWRAWYDLTRGRLLAVSVRLEEFRLACEAAVEPDTISEDTNFLAFAPAMELKSSDRFQRRAKEAEQLLTRCVRDHKNTPWAYLAQRELSHGLGIRIRQRALQPVPLAPAASKPNLPRF